MKRSEQVLLTVLGIGSLMLWALTYVPFIGILTFFLVPTSILIFVSALIGTTLGARKNKRAIIAIAFFVAVALAGVFSRWKDKVQSKEMFAEQQVLFSQIAAPFGTPIQLVLSGANISSTGEIRYNQITSRAPTAKCEPVSMGCLQITGLEWSSEAAWGQPHKVLGRLGMRVVARNATLQANIHVEEQPRSIVVTTTITEAGVLIAQSVRQLPRHKPPRTLDLWFWHVLENNFLTMLIGPRAGFIPNNLFIDFFRNVLLVVPEKPLNRIDAVDVNRVVFDPKKEVKSNEVRIPSLDHCPVSVFTERASGHYVYNLWDQERSVVSSIPTRLPHAICTKEALYAAGVSESDTFTIERYEFNGALSWKAPVHFSFPFELDLVANSLSVVEKDGRATATLDFFDNPNFAPSDRRSMQKTVRLHERVFFSFPIPESTADKRTPAPK